MCPRLKIIVSVVMPAYNVDPYVEEAIRSVLAQKGVPFELLIADDGSTDGTWKCIQSYRADPRVRVWRFRHNCGVSFAGNYLIARSRGRYIASCDADDMMLPGHLKVLTRVLDQNPKVGVVYGDFVQKDRSGKLRLLRRSRGPSETWDLVDGPICNVGSLIRRTLIRKVGGYRTELPYLEDYDFFWRLAEVTQFLYLKSKPLYFYRRRPGSLSNLFKRKHTAAQQSLLREVILRRYGFQVPW